MTRRKRDYQHQQPPPAPEPPPPPTPKPLRWKRALIWAGGVSGALVVAAATAFGTGVGQDLFNHTIGSAASSGPPVIIESAQYQEVFGFGNNFAFPQQLTADQVAPFNSGQGNYANYMARLAAIGGVQVTDAAVEMVLRGNDKQTVVISNMQIASHCTAPINGTLLYSPSAGSPPNIMIGFNLDAQFPIAQNASYGRLFGSYFAGHTITLQPGETQTLVVHAVTDRQYCTFTYKLVVDTGSGQVTENVSNDGKPFAVTALLVEKCGTGYSYAKYQTMYAGGVANPDPSSNGAFVRVNPDTCG